MRKLLEFDFAATVDGAIKGRAAKIGAAEDEVSDERTVECEPQGKIGKIRSRGTR
ncbi:unnamed protein product [Malus baccata var. baccata]